MAKPKKMPQLKAPIRQELVKKSQGLGNLMAKYAKPPKKFNKPTRNAGR